MTAERKDSLSGIPQEEQKFLTSERYGRNGVIPGWTDVISQFDLQELPVGRLRLARAFYRVQRRIAEKQITKARRLMGFLDKDQQFLKFEEQEGSLLSDIAHYVRGAAEKAAKVPILSSSARR